MRGLLRAAAMHCSCAVATGAGGCLVECKLVRRFRAVLTPFGDVGETPSHSSRTEPNGSGEEFCAIKR